MGHLAKIYNKIKNNFKKKLLQLDKYASIYLSSLYWVVLLILTI